MSENRHKDYASTNNIEEDPNDSKPPTVLKKEDDPNCESGWPYRGFRPYVPYNGVEQLYPNLSTYRPCDKQEFYARKKLDDTSDENESDEATTRSLREFSCCTEMVGSNAIAVPTSKHRDHKILPSWDSEDLSPPRKRCDGKHFRPGSKRYKGLEHLSPTSYDLLLFFRCHDFETSEDETCDSVEEPNEPPEYSPTKREWKKND